MLENILKPLNFDEDDIKTYTLLLETGPITVGILAKKMGVSRSSLYGFLKRLVKRGLVIESQKRSVKIFAPEAPEKIGLIFSERTKILEKNHLEFKKLLPNLKQNFSQKFLQPKLQIFEGAEGLRWALKDMLLYYDLETEAFWPQKKMVEIIGRDYFAYHNKERIKNRISVKAIWPKNQMVSIKEHPFFGDGPKFLREIRIAPKDLDFTMGYWIYGNKTAFISSMQESFGFIIESREFTLTQKAQFKVIWDQSKALRINPEDTKEFLKDLQI